MLFSIIFFDIKIGQISQHELVLNNYDKIKKHFENYINEFIQTKEFENNPELTPGQKKILTTFKMLEEKNKNRPTISEMAKVLNVSRPVIQEHYSALERKGYMKRTKESCRNWQINF